MSAKKNFKAWFAQKLEGKQGEFAFTTFYKRLFHFWDADLRFLNTSEQYYRAFLG